MAPRAGILLAAVLILALIGGAPSVSHGQVKLNVVYIVATNAEIQALELLTSPEYQARYGDYRKKYGIEITVKAFMAAGDKYNAIKAGAVDMDVNFGVLPLAVMVAEGIPVRGVALASKADYMIVVRKESPITRIEEFRGKPFGVTTLSGTGYYITDFAFRAVRIDVKKDLQLKSLPPPTLVAALERGDLAGGTLFEPHTFRALKSGRFRALGAPQEIYEKAFGTPWFHTALVAKAETLRRQPQAIWSLVRAIFETAGLLEENAEAVAKRFASNKQFRLDEAMAREVLQAQRRNWINQPLTSEMLGKVQTFYDRMYEVRAMDKPAKAVELFAVPEGGR